MILFLYHYVSFSDGLAVRQSVEFGKERRPAMRKKITLRKTPFVLLVFFLMLWLIGVTVNEPKRVLEQAKSICLSCIGIG